MVDLRKFEIIWIDEAEKDLEKLPDGLQETAVRKLGMAVQRQFKGADRLRNWPGEYRRIRVDDHTRLVFWVDREQAMVVVLSIDPRDKVYMPPNQEKLRGVLEHLMQGIHKTDPVFAQRLKNPMSSAPPSKKA